MVTGILPVLVEITMDLISSNCGYFVKNVTRETKGEFQKAMKYFLVYLCLQFDSFLVSVFNRKHIHELAKTELKKMFNYLKRKDTETDFHFRVVKGKRNKRIKKFLSQSPRAISGFCVLGQNMNFFFPFKYYSCQILKFQKMYFCLEKITFTNLRNPGLS